MASDIKKPILFLFCITSLISARAQKQIIRPDYGFVLSRTTLSIDTVSFTDSSTDLHMTLLYKEGMALEIPKETYIKTPDKDQKYYVSSAQGISLGSNKPPEVIIQRPIHFTLSFPKLPPGTKLIDFGEDIPGGNKICDIQLTATTKIKLPDSMYGEWYSTRNGDLQVAFYKKVAVFDNKLWDYQNVPITKGKGVLTIKNGTHTVSFSFTRIDDLTYVFSRKEKDKDTCSHFIFNCHIDHSLPAYHLPLLKQDSVTLSGYVKDYNDRIGMKILSVVVDDLIAGAKKEYIVEVQKNGYFTTKLPLYRPQYIDIRSALFNSSIYIEPGKQLFTVLQDGDLIYSGPAERLANEMRTVFMSGFFSYPYIQRTAGNMSPQQYKDYCRSLEKKDLAQLDSMHLTGDISDRVFQIGKLEIKYSYANALFDYKPDAATPAKLPASYFDFINADMANDPLAVIAPSYSEFIYRLNGIDRNDSLQLGAGIATDLITTQPLLEKLVLELAPLSPPELSDAEKRIHDPFLSHYVAWCNRQVIAQLELNKKAAGSTVNATPRAAPDHLFDQIMSQYKGKVVYIDFWATWCAPCLSGIKHIAPLKEEMKDKNVVFVYITDESSPLETWKNMIPTIKGEHFRLTNEQWGYISRKFGITGIPHSVLVDKNGKVVSPHLGWLDNDQLKDLIQKEINHP